MGVVIYQGIALSDETMWFVTAVEVDLAQKEPVMCVCNVTISLILMILLLLQAYNYINTMISFSCMIINFYSPQ